MGALRVRPLNGGLQIASSTGVQHAAAGVESADSESYVTNESLGVFSNLHRDFPRKNAFCVLQKRSTTGPNWQIAVADLIHKCAAHEALGSSGLIPPRERRADYVDSRRDGVAA